MGEGLRSATADDVAPLVALVESAYRGATSRRGWTTEADLIDGQRVDADMVRGALLAEDAELLVWEDGGSIVGCCELRDRGSGSVGFGMFAVAPDRQGTGIGDRLLAAAEVVAVERWRAREVAMSVIELRPELIAWYRRRGYDPTGEVAPFPYGDERFGRPRRDDLRFVVLTKAVGPA